MSEIRKDHPIGTGAGAVAGGVAGATVGAVGGPAGMAVGAVVGAVLGAAAGDGIGEAINPTAYGDYWKSNYASRPYFSSGREWSDYEPAYTYAYRAHGGHPGKSFNDVEADLQREWQATRGESRLEWNEARGAVRDGWQYVQNGKTAQPQ
jgi:hypothetical protein